MSRALLVIDVQREYFEGAFPIRHPVGHLDAILQVMDVAKQANVPTDGIHEMSAPMSSSDMCGDASGGSWTSSEVGAS